MVPLTPASGVVAAAAVPAVGPAGLTAAQFLGWGVLILGVIAFVGWLLEENSDEENVDEAVLAEASRVIDEAYGEHVEIRIVRAPHAADEVGSID